MKKVFALIAVVALVFAMSAQAASNNDGWGTNYTGQRLNVTSVKVHCATNYVDSFKDNGYQTLGGPGTNPSGGQSNFCMDAYSAPTWATSISSVFTYEDYVFSGGSAAQVDHRTIVANNDGPWPTPVSLAFAWQPCNNGLIFPPVPSTVGTTLDGNTIALTLPYNGIWYITVGISGFAPDDYDWGFLARYDGTTPIPPTSPANDMLGISPAPDYYLLNSGDTVGNGKGSGRPWCFRVQ